MNLTYLLFNNNTLTVKQLLDILHSKNKSIHSCLWIENCCYIDYITWL